MLRSHHPTLRHVFSQSTLSFHRHCLSSNPQRSQIKNVRYPCVTIINNKTDLLAHRLDLVILWEGWRITCCDKMLVTSSSWREGGWHDLILHICDIRGVSEVEGDMMCLGARPSCIKLHEFVWRSGFAAQVNLMTNERCGVFLGAVIFHASDWKNGLVFKHTGWYCDKSGIILRAIITCKGLKVQFHCAGLLLKRLKWWWW